MKRITFFFFSILLLAGCDDIVSTGPVQAFVQSLPARTQFVLLSAPQQMVAGEEAVLRLTAYGTASSAQEVTGEATFTSSNPEIVLVEGKTATAVSVGEATITATYGDLSTEQRIEVTSAPRPPYVLFSQLAPGSNNFAVGEVVSFAHTAYMSDGHQVDITEVTTFESSDASVFEVVGNRGEALSGGRFTITATYVADGDTTSSEVAYVVESPEVVFVSSLTITPGSDFLEVGDVLRFRVTGHNSDGTSEDVTDRASFSIGDNSVLEKMETGVRALSPGKSKVTAGLASASLSVEANILVMEPKPTTGALRVIVFPSDFEGNTAYVEVAGIGGMSSPGIWDDLQPGEYAVTVSLPGYSTYGFDAIVEAGVTTQLAVTLTQNESNSSELFLLWEGDVSVRYDRRERVIGRFEALAGAKRLEATIELGQTAGPDQTDEAWCMVLVGQTSQNTIETCFEDLGTGTFTVTVGENFLDEPYEVLFMSEAEDGSTPQSVHLVRLVAYR